MPRPRHARMPTASSGVTAHARPSQGERMISQTDIRDLIGTQVLDRDGDKIGKIGQIFLDDETGAPEWATVNTGFFGASESFVPLRDADRTGDAVRVPYDKSTV